MTGGFKAFLSTVRSEPGFGLRLVSSMAFGFALLVTKGITALVIAVAAGLTIAFLVGYPYFRARGRIWGGSRR